MAIMLLLTALLAVLVTAPLVWDLTRSLRTVVISETNRSLENAVRELSQELSEISADATREQWDLHLKETSYEVLQFYFDVEGGYLFGQDVIGHSFPTIPNGVAH